MARRDQSSFQRTLDHDVTPNLQGRHGGSQVKFVLQIRKFLKDDNGHVVGEDRFQEEWFLPEFEFGSYRHRKLVARRLRELAGCCKRRKVRRMLARFFSNIKKLILLERQKETNSEAPDDIPRVTLRFKKFARWEDYSEARAQQFSMQEAPKPVPATKESIQALQNLNLEGNLPASTEDCMICLEKLSSGTDQVITSMPCSHLFHGDCIKKWLNTSHYCPLCRFPMSIDATP